MAVCKVAHFRALEDGSEVFVPAGAEIDDAADETLFDALKPASKPETRRRPAKD